MDKRKILNKKSGALLLSFLFIATVSAVWMYSWDGENVITVGSEYVSFSDNLGAEFLSTTNESQTVTKDLTIINPTDDILKLVLEYDEDVEDVVDDCDNTGDLSTTLRFNGVDVVSDDVLNATTGENHLVLNSTLARGSCPQNITTTLSLEEE